MSHLALLSVDKLSTGYGGAPAALHEIDFEAHTGQIIAVLGPNGGGKTTLFRAVLGELPPRAGSIQARGRIGYVPQTERSRLDFPVSALDVVLMGTYGRTPWYRRIGRRERATARATLDRVGLGEKARLSYGSLSGGQRQRVLIARALAQEAEVLLLDEPLTGVDQPGAERVLAILEELRSEGAALLVATHDLRQARRFDRVLCLNRRQVGFGAPAETLDTDTVEETYGGDLVVLDSGERAVAVQHHEHP